MKRLLTSLSLLMFAGPALAQRDYAHARIRFVDPGVTLQRATETAAEEALSNFPFLPGDRVWTGPRGRAEFQFAEGSLLRLDTRSKLDYVAHDSDRNGERAVLRLWSGALFLRTMDDSRYPDFDIETPTGMIEVRERGVFRINATSNETQVLVYEGRATLDSGRRRVTAGSGQMTSLVRGEAPDAPRRFERAALDEFSRWDEEREERGRRRADSHRYLPDELDPYAGDFETYGSWYHEGDIGYIWRPHVSAGWRPYWDGRWIWTAYGWTWVPHEPWGWAPFHYGRWGHSVSIGWYWIPGNTWSPAWVSWAVGRDTVGWCPLGQRDRPVQIRDRSRGHAVPRGTVTDGSTPAWVYTQQRDFGLADVSRRRFAAESSDAPELRTIDPNRGRLARDLRVAETDGAVPRSIRTRPTPGDTVPELRSDPATTIPHPFPRTRRDERREEATERARPRPESTRYDRERAVPSDEPSEQPHRELEPSSRELGRPRRERPTPAAAEPPPPEGGAGPRNEREERSRPSDPDRDVLRRFFRSLGEERPRANPPEDRGTSGGTRQRGEGETARPRSEGASEGAREAGATEGHSSGEGAHRAKRPRKEDP